eukprot:4556712-Pleurochrysis_carterae.AAC.2
MTSGANSNRKERLNGREVVSGLGAVGDPALYATGCDAPARARMHAQACPCLRACSRELKLARADVYVCLGSEHAAKKDLRPESRV